MAGLTDFVKRSGEGGSGLIQVYTIVSPNFTTPVSPTDLTGTSAGIPNIKTSALAGSIASRNLSLTFDAQILEQETYELIMPLINHLEATEKIDTFENGMEIKDIANIDNMTKCGVIYYYPPVNSLVLGICFEGVMTKESGTVTTAQGERNSMSITITGVQSTIAKTCAKTLFNTNLIVAPSEDVVIPAGKYGQVVGLAGGTSTEGYTTTSTWATQATA